VGSRFVHIYVVMWTKWGPIEYCFYCYLILFLTLILPTWRIWWAPNNDWKWQIGFNSVFKGLIDLKMAV